MCTDMSTLTVIDKTGAHGGERPEFIAIQMPREGEAWMRREEKYKDDIERNQADVSATDR